MPGSRLGIDSRIKPWSSGPVNSYAAASADWFSVILMLYHPFFSSGMFVGRAKADANLASFDSKFVATTAAGRSAPLSLTWKLLNLRSAP